jgi:lysyl-tRNA synthetase class 2
MNDTPSGDRQSSGAASAGGEWWRADRLAEKLPRLRARNRAAAGMREWFSAHDFVEVETPALQISPGLEPQLRAFATRLFEPFEENGQTLYLHTSPEFAMKKLLAGGMERIFQLSRVWRNAERSALHHPEFTMLEWYRARAGWRDIASDCEALVHDVAGKGGLLHRDGKTCDPTRNWEFLSVADAFCRDANIDLMESLSDPAAPDRDVLAEAAKRESIRIADSDGWDDIFHRIMLERVEPSLGGVVPTVLHSWPAPLASLARIDPADCRLAERFEVYACGVELANGFGELTDPAEQRRRFEADIERKKSLTGEVYPIDEEFLSALGSMPESAGIALGFDRLVMLLTGAPTIDDVLWAPVTGS